MKFGCCCSIDKLPLLKEYGFDYCELNFSSIATATEEEFLTTLRETDRYSLPAEAFNGFFSPTTSLNAGVDYDSIREYCKTGFRRAKQLGGKVAVLGSGGARRIPEGYDRTLAEEQFVQVLRICGEEAAKQDMQIAIEPLRERETNFINTVAEGMIFVQRAAHPNVKCLADFYHVAASGESLEAIETAGNDLIHVHISAPDRSYPTVADAELCKTWKAALDKCGYNARISLEGKGLPDFETAIQKAKAALDLFR